MVDNMLKGTNKLRLLQNGHYAKLSFQGGFNALI